MDLLLKDHMRKMLCAVALLMIALTGFSRQVSYPYPVKHFDVLVENQLLKMGFMDVSPAKPNGQVVVLFHGKNFNGYYWKNVIPFLLDAGFRVIVPDQIGWGQSSRANIHYSFHLLANNTRQLLDSINVTRCIIIGHSMGGMLATRFSLMYPDMVTKLILENPIGLEDYKTFVPYKTTTELARVEKAATYESYKKYQQGYYPEWKPEYEQYVQAQAADLQSPKFDSIAWVNALTYQMIYEQPVVYEFSRLKVPALLIIGQADRTVVGKNQLTEAQKKVYGNYPVLGKQLQQQIKSAKLITLPGVGHIPHVQTPGLFQQYVLEFIKK